MTGMGNQRDHILLPQPLLSLFLFPVLFLRFWGVSHVQIRRGSMPERLSCRRDSHGLAGFQQARRLIFCRLLTVTIMTFSDSCAPCCGQATREIIYSWNEGLNWTHFEFWDHTIEVENIITEPTGTSQVLWR